MPGPSKFVRHFNYRSQGEEKKRNKAPLRTLFTGNFTSLAELGTLANTLNGLVTVLLGIPLWAAERDSFHEFAAPGALKHVAGTHLGPGKRQVREILGSNRYTVITDL